MSGFDLMGAQWVVDTLFGETLRWRFPEWGVIVSIPDFDPDISGTGITKNGATIDLANKVWDLVHNVPEVAYQPLQTLAMARHMKFKGLWEHLVGTVQ